MSKSNKTKNDIAWESIFDDLKIVDKVDKNGSFEISADKIKTITAREPRLMTKFDQLSDLPECFHKQQLSILPITRGKYIISHFSAYHKFDVTDTSVFRFSLPSNIQSLDVNRISSETVALNCAFASGILSDFLEDENLLPTLSGRMGSGKFDFCIQDSRTKSYQKMNVTNAQIEIDATYEGLNALAVFEAKKYFPDDFIIRQLYYPYRVCKQFIKKPIRPVFLMYSNSIFKLYEYKFTETNNYNSIMLIKQKNYSLEEIEIDSADIQSALKSAPLLCEPNLPFPQADKFERVINLCELLNTQTLNKYEITEHYGFDERQTAYYTSAALYLGLSEKNTRNGEISYSLSDEGKRIMNLPYKRKQLEFCRLILGHRAFSETLSIYFNNGKMPNNETIVEIMKKSELYRITKDSTFYRRASTVRGWVEWIVGLITKD
jgi:hypothetical protein